jgi:hypothetical protein
LMTYGSGLQQWQAERELDQNDQQLERDEHRDVHQHMAPRKMTIHIY